MAVSQFLRPGGLLDTIKSFLAPDIVRSASSVVGEPEGSTRQTLAGAVPSVLYGLTNMASSPNGETHLGNLLRDGGYNSVADNVRALFSGGAATSSMFNAGPQLLGTIFGGRGAAVADVVGQVGGVSSASATKLLSLVAPLILSVLAKRASAQNLNASGLASSLLSEKSEIAAAVPPGVSQILSGAGPTVVPPRKEVEKTAEPIHLERVQAETPVAREQARPMRWFPILLAALAALALLLFLRGRTARNAADNVTTPATTAVSNLTLPGGASISVPQGSINYNLAVFLADGSASVPKTFVFDRLNFVSGSTQLTPGSTSTVDDLARILKAYPNAQIQLAGHTDNTGSPQANQSLSGDRANAVKGMLVNQGVAADRISTAGYGQDRPVASNDNEEGRARNRRLELTVTKK
jgi:outer membrane protein OmpA-like peptidoglycan-associated protein